MAIEINGVSLPDIPTDVLDAYPYVVIAEYKYSSFTYYSFLATQDEALYLPPQMMAETAVVSSLQAYTSGTAKKMECGGSSVGTEWTTQLNTSMYGGSPIIGLGENVAGTYLTFDSITLVWSNHDVKTVDSVDTDTGEITVGDEVFFYDSTAVFVVPERVAAPGTWFVAIAEQARRLSNTASRIPIEKIQELLEQAAVVSKTNWMADAVYDPDTNTYTSEAERIFVPAPYSLAGTGVVTVNLPNAIEIQSHSDESGNYLGWGPFRGCTTLTTLNAPLLERTCPYAFEDSGLTSITLPSLRTVGSDLFRTCNSLAKVDLPIAGSIGGMAFAGCGNLKTLILRKTTAVAYLYTGALNGTPIAASKTGYVYVPSALVSAYKTDSNWSTYASQIRAIEDYPDICGAPE